MTTQDQIDLAAVITTAAEFDYPIPASTVYMALGCDLDRYERISGLCARAGLIKKTATTLEITADGRKIADALNAAIAETKAETVSK